MKIFISTFYPKEWVFVQKKEKNFMGHRTIFWVENIKGEQMWFGEYHKCFLLTDREWDKKLSQIQADKVLMRLGEKENERL